MEHGSGGPATSGARLDSPRDCRRDGRVMVGSWRPTPAHPTATWPWSSSASPRRPPWPRAGGWGVATRKAPTAPRSRPCACVLQIVAMDGVVVIGEGEKDHAPMLYNGERIGDGIASADRHRRRPHRRDEPRPSLGRGGALAVIAVSDRGTMFNPGPCVYMEKLAVGPKAVGSVDMRRSPDREPRGRGQGARASPSATSPSSSSTGPGTPSSSTRCGPAGPASS